MSMEQNKVAELPPGWVAGWSGTTREPRPFGLLMPPPADAIIFNDPGENAATVGCLTPCV